MNVVAARVYDINDLVPRAENDDEPRSEVYVFYLNQNIFSMY